MLELHTSTPQSMQDALGNGDIWYRNIEEITTVLISPPAMAVGMCRKRALDTSAGFVTLSHTR